mmetsp:Transcript_16256/g.38401  ORF Transcript_16256/g.38401 Transcript_16256/m.38401 type:complete len:218 (+) Transcript_16256:930-1583(+)
MSCSSSVRRLGSVPKSFASARARDRGVSWRSSTRRIRARRRFSDSQRSTVLALGSGLLGEKQQGILTSGDLTSGVNRSCGNCRGDGGVGALGVRGRVLVNSPGDSGLRRSAEALRGLRGGRPLRASATASAMAKRATRRSSHRLANSWARSVKGSPSFTHGVSGTSSAAGAGSGLGLPTSGVSGCGGTRGGERAHSSSQTSADFMSILYAKLGEAGN